MSGLFFRGTNADQDTRFSNKNAKLLKNHKFPPELDTPVNFSVVQMGVIKPWIAKRVTELLGLEDEVVIDMIYNLLSEKNVDGKKVQIEITGFLEKNAGKFMKELWTLLLSAQKNPSGIPQIFLDVEEEKQAKKKAAEAFLNAEFQKSKNVEVNRVKEMQEAADLVAKQKEARAAAARINANLKAGPPQDGGPVTKVEDAKMRVAERRSSSRSRSRSLSRSPSDRNDRRASSPYGRGRRSRSPPPRRRRSLSRSFSPSPPPRRRSPPPRRRSPSGYSSRYDRNLGSHNSRPLPYDDRRDRDWDRDREYRGRGSDRYPDRREDGRRDPYEDRQRSRRNVDVSREERSSHRDVEERGRRSPEESRKVGRGEIGRNRDRIVTERSDDESVDLSADDAKADKKLVKEEADSEEDEGYVKKKARGPDSHGRRVMSEDEEDDEDVKRRESGGLKVTSGEGKARVDRTQGGGEKEIKLKAEQEREVRRVPDDIKDVGKLKSGNVVGRSNRKQYSDEEEDDGEKRGTTTNYRSKGREYDEDVRDKKSQSVKVETVGIQVKARDENRHEKATSFGEERGGVQERSGVKSSGKRVVKVEAGKKADDESEERSEDSEDERQARKERWQEAKSEKAMNKPGVGEEKEQGMEDEEARRKRKEEKRKRKEERRVKRELKRKRQEEKKRRKEGEKMRDHENVSEEEERSEDPGRQKEMEISLRKKVMESLKSKKQAM